MGLDRKRSRRDFLRNALAFAAIGTLAAGELQYSSTAGKREVEALRAKDGAPIDRSFLQPNDKPEPYDTSDLEGRKFGFPVGPYYIGASGGLGRTTLISFPNNLRRMWGKKLSRMEPMSDVKRDVVVKTVERIVTSYAPESANRMSLDQYRLRIEGAIAEAQSLTDWNRIQKHFGFNDADISFMRRAADALDAKTLLSIALTELMTDESGSLNKTVLDFLLQNAGSGYVERLPAFDKHYSHGPYQMTKFAIGEGKRDAAASLMNKLLKRPVLPPNVGSLEGDQHHSAAYLTGLYNLALLVSSMKENGTTAFYRHTGDAHAALPLYTAAAHHRPADARAALNALAREAMQGRRRGASPAYEDYCSSRIRGYVQRMKMNMAAL
ncbi:MAG: hypothetical protein UY98_C0001G0010 [Candidatus Kaiserbacteria bacterium GW2011_GWA2_58_9]|uniref:Uncharacterized protein n=1 Tax=Candidatus Kaiserbacteria bacterium GW2011_GWA2_58_9 TaxID=1618672 RepID=A0A0G1YWX2_9BACT|nr:MAG: hypothetical protein UY98_C0001G0010 [Candidatus Kaiserbacteria bacterium GW2011_GWA2_58_9]